MRPEISGIFYVILLLAMTVFLHSRHRMLPFACRKTHERSASSATRRRKYRAHPSSLSSVVSDRARFARPIRYTLFENSNRSGWPSHHVLVFYFLCSPFLSPGVPCCAWRKPTPRSAAGVRLNFVVHLCTYTQATYQPFSKDSIFLVARLRPELGKKANLNSSDGRKTRHRRSIGAIASSSKRHK